MYVINTEMRMYFFDLETLVIFTFLQQALAIAVHHSRVVTTMTTHIDLPPTVNLPEDEGHEKFCLHCS